MAGVAIHIHEFVLSFQQHEILTPNERFLLTLLVFGNAVNHRLRILLAKSLQTIEHKL